MNWTVQRLSDLQLSRLPGIGLGIWLSWGAIALPTRAQIIPDTSLGTQATGGCGGAGICDITGGTPAGANLFHSFSEFSFSGAGAETRFLVDPSVGSIFSRVTGGKVSNIDGLLSVSGSAADLFFMNPAGIVFGPNARLDLQGSFTATTATGIEFDGVGSFDLTTASNQVDLLTINPTAFLYNQIPQAISTQPGAELIVPESETLRLAGGAIDVRGGVLRAPGGLLDLIAMGSAGEVSFGSEFSPGSTRADVTFSEGAIADVVASGNGSILISAHNIEVSGQNTYMCAGIGSDGSSCGASGTSNGSEDSLAGIILLDATEAIKLSDSARIENNINIGATGNQQNIFEAIEQNDYPFGSIALVAKSVTLSENSEISTTTYGNGSSGILIIRASDSVTLQNSGVFSRVSESANGDAGGILISAERLLATSESLIQASIQGIAETNQGGRIIVEVGSLELSKNSKISTSTSGFGNAGFVYISARDRIILDRLSEIESRSQENAEGNAGIILVGGEFISLGDQSKISTTADGRGSGGIVFLIASRDILLDQNSEIFSNAQQDARNGGLIFLFADRIIVSNDGTIAANNLSSGEAVAVNSKLGFGPAEELLGTANGQSVNRLGEAGAVVIDARRLVLDQSSSLEAATFNGLGGNVLLGVEEYIVLSKNSLIRTDSGSEFLGGDGGDILLETLFLIGTPRNNSDIIANAFEGNGGNIFIEAKRLFSITERPIKITTNDINADSKFGLNGSISVNALDIDPSRSLDDLPETRLPDLLAEGCRPTGRPVPKDKFYATGLGGLPPNPNDILRSSTVLANLEETSAPSVATAPLDPAGSPEPVARSPVAAQGWVRDEHGEVFFSANVPNLGTQSGLKPYSSCSGAS